MPSEFTDGHVMYYQCSHNVSLVRASVGAYLYCFGHGPVNFSETTVDDG